jgi:two-component system chemotaxis response regulator CheB
MAYSDFSSSTYCAFDVVGLAASLGGLSAVGDVLAALPPDFPAGIVVVQHLSSRYPSHLPEILQRRSLLPVRWAEPGDHVQAGTVLLARPGRHAAIGPGGALTFSSAPKVQFVRPSADVLFSTIARTYAARGIGVVLSGSLRDGADGAQAIKSCGGRVLVQDIRTAQASGMPGAAIATGCFDFMLPLAMIPHALVALVMAPGAAQFLHVQRSARS